jgi:putative hydrolase of the HAD superfamily
MSKDSYFEAWLELDDNGYRPKEELFRSLVESGAFTVSAAELLDDFRERYERSYIPMPEALTTLTELRKRGLRLGIVTNGRTEIQSAKVHSIGLDQLVHAVLISESEGIKKPAPEIFRRAAQKLSAEPAECLFVGDHPQIDVAGAESAGMRGVWLKNDLWPPPAVPTPQIGRLSELLERPDLER